MRVDEVPIQRAHLILLDGGFKAIEEARACGVKVPLATNSMASNNHLTAFVGYRKQPKRMLATGAESHEMRPDAKSERALFTDEQLAQFKPNIGLHAKTMVFDRKVTFKGSFNLDPRSVNLNTEMGLLVESPSLSLAVTASVENGMAPGNSLQVIIQDVSSPSLADYLVHTSWLEPTTQVNLPSLIEMVCRFSQESGSRSLQKRVPGWPATWASRRCGRIAATRIDASG
ncbi:cardiolipin synthetase [Planctomycetes bacterium CA13]|uniref:Cardiolipin synthetase n=1 Tax=Novipirellula herctigrandis TaxID=2527986 RepID=A0A5C5Z243_9BACT|nr:cardiolipin synthetase [Planctomycetes bacterium CA13]